MTTKKTQLGRTVSIVGTGSYAPERILTNAELEKMVETTDEWIVTRTGIRERHIASAEQATSDLAAEAGRRALADAGVQAEDVGLIIVATITPDMGFPSTGCLVQTLIGANKAFCFDLEAACSGFIFALETAKNYVASGAIETALVIGAEKMSSFVDWNDRNTCVLFGDAAGAAVVQARGASHGLMASAFGSDGSLGELLMLPAGGSRRPASDQTVKDRLHYLKMAGREVFKHAVNNMVASSKEALRRAGLTAHDIDWIIPHQANLRIIDAIADRLGEPREKLVINLDRYGNTSAATIAVALDELSRSGKLKKGHRILLTAFGGGFTWGASVVEWDK